MPQYPRRFWRALQTGVEVAVAAPDSPKLLGVRDGFRTFLEVRLPPAAAVLVVPQHDDGGGAELPLSDERTVTLVEAKAAELHRRLGENYQFYVAAEGGLDIVEAEEGLRAFVRYWAAIASDLGSAAGSSSAVEVPRKLLDGLGGEEIPFAIPGTRRSGGMLAALTAGRDTPRMAIARATSNALATLFYGILEGRGPYADPRRGVPSPPR